MSPEFFVGTVKNFALWASGDTSQAVKERATLEEVRERLRIHPIVEEIEGGIRVRVEHPDSRAVNRMMTSLNDPVGTLVRYAEQSGGSYDLTLTSTAMRGQHVFIELGQYGGKRVLVYPGE